MEEAKDTELTADYNEKRRNIVSDLNLTSEIAAGKLFLLSRYHYGSPSFMRDNGDVEVSDPKSEFTNIVRSSGGGYDLIVYDHPDQERVQLTPCVYGSLDAERGTSRTFGVDFYLTGESYKTFSELRREVEEERQE